MSRRAVRNDINESSYDVGLCPWETPQVSATAAEPFATELARTTGEKPGPTRNDRRKPGYSTGAARMRHGSSAPVPQEHRQHAYSTTKTGKNAGLTPYCYGDCYLKDDGADNAYLEVLRFQV